MAKDLFKIKEMEKDSVGDHEWFSLVRDSLFEPEQDDLFDQIDYTEDEESWLKGMLDAIDPDQTVSSDLIIAWLEKNNYFIPEPHPVLKLIIEESE